MDYSKVDMLRQYIEDSADIVVITGAGISVPSGIPDFRSATGIYKTSNGKGRSPEYMLSHTCFEMETEDFYTFYREKIIHRDAPYNLAHEYLAYLERTHKVSTIITQNIDGLHEMAGSRNVINFHGSIYENYCTRCGSRYSLDEVISGQNVPICPRCGGVIRPDVVLYEEQLCAENIERSMDAIRGADMLLVIGTSLVVYPAAGLINYYRGDKLVLINKSPTTYDSYANLVLNEDIIDVVRALGYNGQ